MAACRAFDRKGIGEEGRDGVDDWGGLKTRGIDMIWLRIFYCRPLMWRGQAGVVLRLWLDQALGSVVASFVGCVPWDGNEGALEEGIIDDVALVIFALDDPVTGKDFALAGVGEDEGGICALCCVYQKGPAGSERFQSSSPCRRVFVRQDLSHHFAHKKGVRKM